MRTPHTRPPYTKRNPWIPAAEWIDLPGERWLPFKETFSGPIPKSGPPSPDAKYTWQASTEGRIRCHRNSDNHYCLKTSHLTGGSEKYNIKYLALSGSANCQFGNYIHRVVASLFIPNPDNLPCVDHINGVYTDNRVENLRWVTYSENMKGSWARRKAHQATTGEKHVPSRIKE